MLGVAVHAFSFISSTPLLLRRASFKHSGLMTFKMSTVQKSTIDCPLNTGRGCCNEDSQNFTIESFQSDQGKLNVKTSASMRVKECQVMSKFEEAGNSKREVQIKKDLDIKCYDGFEKLTVTKLREMLRKQGIQPSGRKQDLIQTLRNLFVDNNAENLHKQNEFNENGKSNMGYDITSSSNLPGKESSGNGTSQSQQKVDELDCCLDKSTGSKRRKLSKNIECESPSSTYYAKEDISQHEAVRPCSLLVHKKPQPEWVAYNPDLMRSKQFSSENTVKVISWNVNGLRALLKKKENFFSQLVERENFDVICLQETKLQEKDVEAIKGNLLDGYDHSFWTCSASKLGYAGTAVISRIKPISVTFGLGIPDHDSEGRLITVEFESVFLVAGYIPNSGQNLERLTYRVQRWDPCLSSYIKDLEKKKPVVLTGDLNCAYEEIDIYNPDGNHRSAGFTDEERKSFEESFLKRGFVDSFRRKHPNTVAYTYWGYRQNARQGNRGWRLDYFLVSESIAESVYDSYTIPDINGSDHCPIGLVLKYPVL